MIATTQVKRPALRFYGGKWKIASWIIEYFPPHLNYIEPCSGACSVLLQKPRSVLETVNDLDGRITTFFRTLRDRPNELIQKIQLTLWARAEYELSLRPCQDEIEQARRFYISCWMSYNGGTGDNPRLFGWRHTTDSRSRLPASFDIINHGLNQITQRLQGVQIENEDYKKIIRAYDNDAALIYLDPPYVAETRTNNVDWYAHEWSDNDHIEAAGLLHQTQGYVVVSGYACPLYTELYETRGWQRVDKESQTNSGGKRIESLWLSPRTAEALRLPRQKALF